MKLLVPIILIVISGGIYLGYIDGAYDTVKTLQAEEQQYEDALRQSETLNRVRNELLTTYNNISTRDLDRLDKMLPNNIDSIRLLIDIDGIAAENGVALSDLEAEPSGVDGSEGSIGIVRASFTTTATYQVFKNLLRDLESSLRLFDINAISISAPTSESAQPGTLRFNVDLQTYWIN